MQWLETRPSNNVPTKPSGLCSWFLFYALWSLCWSMCHKLGSNQVLLYPVTDGHCSRKNWSLSSLSPAFSHLLSLGHKARPRLLMKDAPRAAPLHHPKVIRSIYGGNSLRFLCYENTRLHMTTELWISAKANLPSDFAEFREGHLSETHIPFHHKDFGKCCSLVVRGLGVYSHSLPAFLPGPIARRCPRG